MPSIPVGGCCPWDALLEGFKLVTILEARPLPLQRYVEAPNLREPGTCPGASQMMPALSLKQEELAAALFCFLGIRCLFFNQKNK